MSQPIEPTPPAPGAPTDPAAPTTPPTAGPQTPPAVPTMPTQPAGEDIDSLPDWAQKALRQARDEAGKARNTAKQNAAEEARQALAQEIAGVLGLGGEEPIDPATLADQVQQAQAAAWGSAAQLSIYKAAGRLGASAEALMDSVSFVDGLDDLVDVDPNSAEFTGQLDGLIRAAMERDSRFKAGGSGATPAGVMRPDPTQGARGNVPPDREALIRDAQSKGDWRTVLKLQNAKLAELAAKTK